MARFARACLAKMQSLLVVLVDHLGDDTANLSFRVGLHSGQVTAGVLRGGKPTRFLCCVVPKQPYATASMFWLTPSFSSSLPERSRFQFFGDVSL